MAKRRKSIVKRTSSRRSFFKLKAKRGKSVSTKINPIQIDSMLYGVARSPIAQLMQPITAKLPFLEVSDELALGVANYFIAKNTSGIIKKVALKGLVIENARVGEYVGNMILAKTGLLQGTNNQVDNSFVYG